MLRLLVSLAIVISAFASSLDQTPLLDSHTSYPSLLKYVDSLSPNFVAPNTIPFRRSPFLVHYAGAQADPSLRLDSLLKFTGIPSSAHSCALSWAFPSGWFVEAAGVSALNVYKVDRDAEDTDSWNDSPQEVTLFGTTTLGSGGSGFVNSGTCSKSMSFRIEVSRDSGGMGHVSFSQSNGPSHWGQPPAGWLLTYET